MKDIPKRRIISTVSRRVITQTSYNIIFYYSCKYVLHVSVVLTTWDIKYMIIKFKIKCRYIFTFVIFKIMHLIPQDGQYDRNV